MGPVGVARMISAQIRGHEVWCGRPGCKRGRKLGQWGRIGTGTVILILSQRWHWDATVQPARWRWERRGNLRARSRLHARHGATVYAQNWAAGAIVASDPQGRPWITVTLPTDVECPDCEAVQRVESGLRG
jgi:hypothetical protein